MTNTFVRYIILDWYFFPSQLEINHPSPPCLQTFAWEMCCYSHIPFFYGTWLFLACIFQHTLFGLYLVFTVSNLWQFECVWSQLKHKPVVTLGRDFLNQKIRWSRKTYLKCGLHCLVAAQIKGHEKRKLCFTCLSSLSGEIPCILLLIHSFLVIITKFIRIPVQSEDHPLSRNLWGLQCRSENSKTFISVNNYYKPLLDELDNFF